MRNKTQRQLDMAVSSRVSQADQKGWKDWIKEVEKMLKVEGAESKTHDTSGADQFAKAVQLGQVF